MAARKVMRVLITATDRDTILALLRERKPEVAGSATILANGAVRINAFVLEKNVNGLKRRGVTVEVLGDQSAITRERRKEVGKGNRFLTGDPVPHGLGVKVRDGGGHVS
jgi:hypothetical protein